MHWVSTKTRPPIFFLAHYPPEWNALLYVSFSLQITAKIGSSKPKHNLLSSCQTRGSHSVWRHCFCGCSIWLLRQLFTNNNRLVLAVKKIHSFLLTLNPISKTHLMFKLISFFKIYFLCISLQLYVVAYFCCMKWSNSHLD